jgi:LCP family protein required for cell wall assembly
VAPHLAPLQGRVMRADFYGSYPDEGHRRRMLTRIVRWTGGILAVLLVIGVVTGYFVYRHLDHNLEALDPDLGTDRPSRILVPGERQPLNILLIGSEERDGGTGARGTSGGGGESTTILLHVSADRRLAYGVSIPPNLVISRPECPSTSGDGVVFRDKAAAFDTAYRVGREGCVVRTVEAMTNIRIDHFVVTSFDGLTAAADALDGVPIWMARRVYDPRLDVTIPAGRSEAKGDVALSYVTMRLDDSSDIGRIRRQQAFLAAMTTKALSTGTLTNPFRLYGFLDRATQAIAVDEGLASLRKLADLTGDIKDIGRDNVHFLTMPIAPVAAAKDRFAIGPGAASLWSRLRRDQELTSEELLGSSTSAGRP